MILEALPKGSRLIGSNTDALLLFEAGRRDLGSAPHGSCASTPRVSGAAVPLNNPFLRPIA
jgi:hypothetical protein